MTALKKVVSGQKSVDIHKSIDDDYFNHFRFYYPRMKRVKNFNNLNKSIFRIFLSCDENNFEQIFTELPQKIGHIMIPVNCGYFGIHFIISDIHKGHGMAIHQEKMFQ